MACAIKHYRFILKGINIFRRKLVSFPLSAVTNAVAYRGIRRLQIRRFFIIQTPWVDLIKPSLMFVGKARSLP